MKLITAALVANFGHGSSRPKQNALGRLVLIAIGSIALSIGSVRSLLTVQSSLLPLPLLSALGVCFALQCLIACGNIASLVSQKSPAIPSVGILPISQLRQRLLNSLNHLAYTAFILIVAVPVFALFLFKAGVTPVPAILLLLVASLSGCGLFYVTTTIKLGKLVALALLGAEYIALRQLAAHPQTLLWAALFSAVTICCCAGLLRFGSFADHLSHKKKSVKLYAAWLNNRFWFTKKVARSSFFKSLATTGVFAATLALYAHHIQLFNSDLLAFLASLLGAANAADIRSICRARWPAEITAIRGTPYFVGKEVLSLLAVYAAISPLVILAFVYSSNESTSLAVLLSSLASVCLGLFIGTIFTPYPGDISAQVTSVVCSSIVLLVIQRVAPLPITYCLLLTCSTIGSFIHEYIRNPFTWRYQRGVKKSTIDYQ